MGPGRGKSPQGGRRKGSPCPPGWLTPKTQLGRGSGPQAGHRRGAAGKPTAAAVGRAAPHAGRTLRLAPPQARPASRPPSARGPWRPLRGAARGACAAASPAPPGTYRRVEGRRQRGAGSSQPAPPPSYRSPGGSSRRAAAVSTEQQRRKSAPRCRGGSRPVPSRGPGRAVGRSAAGGGELAGQGRPGSGQPRRRERSGAGQRCSPSPSYGGSHRHQRCPHPRAGRDPRGVPGKGKGAARSGAAALPGGCAWGRGLAWGCARRGGPRRGERGLKRSRPPSSPCRAPAAAGGAARKSSLEGFVPFPVKPGQKTFWLCLTKEKSCRLSVFEGG